MLCNQVENHITPVNGGGLFSTGEGKLKSVISCWSWYLWLPTAYSVVRELLSPPELSDLRLLDFLQDLWESCSMALCIKPLPHSSWCSWRLRTPSSASTSQLLSELHKLTSLERIPPFWLRTPFTYVHLLPEAIVGGYCVRHQQLYNHSSVHLRQQWRCGTRFIQTTWPQLPQGCCWHASARSSKSTLTIRWGVLDLSIAAVAYTFSVSTGL